MAAKAAFAECWMSWMGLGASRKRMALVTKRRSVWTAWLCSVGGRCIRSKSVEKIKPCKICGDTPELQVWNDYCRVMCMTCWQRTHCVVTEEEAIKLWNDKN